MIFSAWKKFFVRVEDCQNNIIAVVQVEAQDEEDAKIRAMKALHPDDSFIIIEKEEAVENLENGEVNCVIDEDGDEVDLEEDED